MSGDNCVPEPISKQISPSIKGFPATEGTMNPSTTFIASSRELEVLWRIENFSLFGYFYPFTSFPFSLRCGPEERDTQKFYIHFYPSHPPLVSGTFKLCPYSDGESRSAGKQPPLLRVRFSALHPTTGEYLNFHDKGRILNGVEVKGCKVCSRRFSFLGKNRKFLNFMVQFSSDEPAFEVARLYTCTRIRGKMVGVLNINDSFDNLRKGICVMSRSGTPFDIKSRTSANTNHFEIVIVMRNFSNKPIVQKISTWQKTGEKAEVKEFKVLTTEPEVYVFSNNLSHETIGLLNVKTFPFSFHFGDSERVLENTRETTAIGDRDRREVISPSNSIPPTDKNLAARKEPQARLTENDTDDSENAEDAVSACSTIVTKTKGTEKNTDFTADLVADFHRLYSLHIFSDYSLRVGDRSFPVHRNILSARSEVFRAMFEAEDMLEKRENCSEVKDVDEDTMDRMLRFVYSNELENQDFDGSVKLFATAVKYQIESLKSRCVESLEASLSVQNVCGVLSLAHAHSNQALMVVAKEFLSRNADAVFRSEVWRRFMEEESELACNIMHEKLLENQPGSPE